MQEQNKDDLLNWGQQHELRANDAEARLKLAEEAIEKYESVQQVCLTRLPTR